MKIVELAGKRFGRLAVLKYIETVDGHKQWLCKCDCGVTVNKPSFMLLRENGAKSCGCLRSNSENIKNNGKNLVTHGMSKDPQHRPLYKVWASMRERCNCTTHEFYHRYGGRGISICDEWSTFPPFAEWAYLHGYEKGVGLSLDREDNDKGYSPANCRWVTQLDQCNNMEKTIRVTVEGVEMSFMTAVRKYGCVVAKRTARKRIADGWDPLLALTTPRQDRGA